MRLITPKEFGRIGRAVWYHEKNDLNQYHFVDEEERTKTLSVSDTKKFHSLFGTSPLVCSIIWKKLIEYNFLPRKSCPFHMLWALLFLKLYNNESTLSSIVGTSNRTFRKWSWMFVIAIHKLQSFVVSKKIKFSFPPSIFFFLSFKCNTFL